MLGGILGCGYVHVQVTAPPATPTPTAAVYLTLSKPQATSTSVPSTPLPTPTPTATATPILHVVQKGDTLLEIASDYGVSVHLLIEINDIENPRALSIGQALIIPPDDATLLAEQPTATPTPMPLQVVNLAFYRTPMGSMWCMGEVQNDRDEFIDQVQLEVSLYNAGGELLDRVAAYVATDIVPGHGRAPFALLLPRSLAGGFASYEIVVLSAEPIMHWGRRHRELAVERVEGAMSEGTFTAQGIVRNQGQAHAEDVRITLTVYGSDGMVVGVRQMGVERLAAGEKQAFDLTMIPAAPAVRVEAVAWGMEAVP